MSVLMVETGVCAIVTQDNLNVRMEDFSHIIARIDSRFSIRAGDFCTISAGEKTSMAVKAGDSLRFEGKDSPFHKIVAGDNANVSDIRNSTVKVGDNSSISNVSGFSNVIAGRNASITVTSQRTKIMVGEGSTVNVRVEGQETRRYDVSNNMTVDVMLPNTFYDVLSDGSLELA